MHRGTKMHMTCFILRYSLYCVWKQICSLLKVCLHPEYVSHIYTHGTCLCTESGPSVLHKLEFNLTYKAAIKIIKLARPTFLTFNLYKDKLLNFFEMPWLILQTKIWDFRVIQMKQYEKFPLGVPRWPSLVVEDQRYHCCGLSWIPWPGNFCMPWV